MEEITKATPPQSPDGFTFDLQRFDSTFSGGDGTSTDPYIISSAADLQQLANDVNNDGNNYSGKYLKLTADITLDTVEDGQSNFTPIGDYSNQFSGTFDGDGHTISNLTINLPDNDYVGLFGNVGTGGTVQNVTLDNANISGNNYVGGLVGHNGGTVSGNTAIATVGGDDSIGGLVGYNYVSGTVSGNKFYSNNDAFGGNDGTSENNTQVYKLTVPDGVIVTGDSVKIVSGNYYATGSVTLSATDSNAIIRSTNYTNNEDGTVSLTVSADTDLSSAFTFYYGVSIPSCVDTVSGTSITVNNTTYYQNGSTLTLTPKTGYTLDSTSVTVSANTSISATLADGYYVFGNATDGYTLATTTNTTDYPELVQVYALTLPEGVTADGDIVATADGKTYAAGSVTFTGAKTGYVIDGVNVTQDTTITATVDTANHYVLADNTSTLATADNTTDYPNLVQVYELTLPSGVTASGDTVVTVDGTTYATGEVTLSATDTSKILQNITVNGASDDDGVFTVTADTKVTADIVSGLVFGNGGKSVVVVGTTGDLSSFSSVYSITASKENSTLVGNGKNNIVILEGGGENILTGGGGNDTFKFESGGGIVTDYGIGATKSGDGKTLSAAPGSDVVKVSGNVTGIYFDRAASSKKSATFTAIVTYDSTAVEGEDTQIIVLQNINKKPTKYSSDASKVVYQTNDVAAATLKIWDTSGSKQAVLSASKLKKLFHDDSDLSELSQTVQTQLVKLNSIGDLNLPAVDQLNQNTQATFNDNG